MWLSCGAIAKRRQSANPIRRKKVWMPRMRGRSVGMVDVHIQPQNSGKQSPLFRNRSQPVLVPCRYLHEQLYHWNSARSEKVWTACKSHPGSSQGKGMWISRRVLSSRVTQIQNWMKLVSLRVLRWISHTRNDVGILFSRLRQHSHKIVSYPFQYRVFARTCSEWTDGVSRSKMCGTRYWRTN